MYICKKERKRKKIDTCNRHVVIQYMCRLYTSIICVNMCITCVLHMYYMCMHYMCKTPKHHHFIYKLFMNEWILTSMFYMSFHTLLCQLGFVWSCCTNILLKQIIKYNNNVSVIIGHMPALKITNVVNPFHNWVIDNFYAMLLIL